MYDAEWQKFAETTKGKDVTLAIDGWSTLTNEPILGIMMDTHLITSVDTAGFIQSHVFFIRFRFLEIGHPHTGEYLRTVMEIAVDKARTCGANVVAIVTDSASNMSNTVHGIWVWAYFKKDGLKARCTVATEGGKECGVELVAKYSTTPLAYHLTATHGINKGEPPKKQRRMEFAVMSSIPMNPNELICATWALNGLAYELIDDPLFKRAFGIALPAGMTRHRLSTDMVQFAGIFGG